MCQLLRAVAAAALRRHRGLGLRQRPVSEVGDPAGGRRQAVLTIAADGSVASCATTWQRPALASEAATDDHPFPYVTGRSIPQPYLGTLALILVASVLLVRRGGRPLRGMGAYLDLWFMGAAFLLLETKNVVQFALLFGTTWFVNAAGVRRDPAGRARGGGGRAPGPAPAAPAPVPALPRRWPSPGRSRRRRCRSCPRRCGPRRHGGRLHPDLPGQPRVRPAVQGRRVLDRGLRRQPARGDGRRSWSTCRCSGAAATGRSWSWCRAVWARPFLAGRPVRRRPGHGHHEPCRASRGRWRGGGARRRRTGRGRRRGPPGCRSPRWSGGP